MSMVISANLMLIEQGEALLCRMHDCAYTRTLAPVFGGSIGAHIRHNLDHYRSFLAGQADGRIDYTARMRDVRVETDRARALAEFARVRQGLAILDRSRAELRVRSESNPDSGFVPSSMSRELEFLMSHTVHHYAIVAILCRLQGITVDEDFGVAPSTLRYRAGQCQTATSARPDDAPCAP